MWRPIAAVGFAGALMAWGIGDSMANATCQRLSAQLASLGSGAPVSDASRQRAELARARQLLGQCASVQHASCSSLPGTIRAMEANVARLDRSGTRTDTSAQRARLQAQMRAAGCDRIDQRQREARAAVERAAQGRRPAEPAAPAGFVGFFPFLRPATPEFERHGMVRPPAPDVRPRGEAPSERSLRRRIEDGDAGTRERRWGERNFTPRGNGSFRTLCVRACDGYYWPVSWRSSPGQFGREADMCRAACPNQEVNLFVHRNPGQWSEASVALDGTPYTDLPNAFRYRTTFNPSCQCRPTQDLTSSTDFGEVTVLSEEMRGPVDADDPQAPDTGVVDPPVVRGGFTPLPAAFRVEHQPRADVHVIPLGRNATSDARVGRHGLRGVHEERGRED